jgi:HPt (histidine-containing phosphotransfer) domain-containing protein
VSDFDERMAGLRARFCARAAAERTQIAEALASGDLPEVRRLAHGLSGSGGVFGFPEVSADAEAVEIAVDEQKEPGELAILCERLLQRLDEAAQRA